MYGFRVAAFIFVVATPVAASAQQNDQSLAEQLANPISSLISVPFQYNYDCCYGSRDGNKSTLNIQPVIPTGISPNWNLITRTIVPVHHMDWLPTFCAVAGDPNVKDELLNGLDAGGTTYKIHLDGYNFLPYLTGKEEKAPRDEVFYFSDDGDLMALRYRDWKVVFMEQRANGTLKIWANPFTELRVPKIFNLRRDPYERADVTSNTYYDWMLSRAYILVPAQAYVGKFLETFKQFPPRQKPASFTVGGQMEALEKALSKLESDMQ